MKEFYIEVKYGAEWDLFDIVPESLANKKVQEFLDRGYEVRAREVEDDRA